MSITIEEAPIAFPDTLPHPVVPEPEIEEAAAELTDSEILLLAVQVLGEDGWTKGMMVNPRGARCTDGAIYKACGL